METFPGDVDNGLYLNSTGDRVVAVFSHRPQDGEVDSGVCFRPEPVRRGDQVNLHRTAAVQQVPGHGEPVSAVVPRAADDRDRTLDFRHEVGQAARGVLHQHDAWNADLFHRHTVHETRLGAGERDHAGSLERRESAIQGLL